MPSLAYADDDDAPADVFDAATGSRLSMSALDVTVYQTSGPHAASSILPGNEMLCLLNHKQHYAP